MLSPQCYYFPGTTDSPLTKTNEEAVRSLLVITGSPPSNPDYEDFKETVSLYGEREPFNFPNPFNYPRKVTQLYNSSFADKFIHLYMDLLHCTFAIGAYEIYSFV